MPSRSNEDIPVGRRFGGGHLQLAHARAPVRGRTVERRFLEQCHRVLRAGGIIIRLGQSFQTSGIASMSTSRAAFPLTNSCSHSAFSISKAAGDSSGACLRSSSSRTRTNACTTARGSSRCCTRSAFRLRLEGHSTVAVSTTLPRLNWKPGRSTESSSRGASWHPVPAHNARFHQLPLRGVETPTCMA